MADREFKIIISGDASGLQSAAKDGASSLNDYLNPAIQNYGKDWKAANAGVEETVKKGELKHMVRELKRDFPELGMLARTAINPLVGGFGLLLGTLKGIDEIFKGIIERSNTGIFSGTFRRDVAAATKEAIEGEVAWRAFSRSMESVAKAQESVKDKTEGAIAAIRAQHVAQTEQQNAAKAAALARVDMLEKEGKISEPQAIQERLKVEEKFARAKLLSEIVAKDAEIEAKRKEVEKLNKDAQLEMENAAQAKQQMEDANRDLERFRALKAGTEKALTETDKQVKALSHGLNAPPDLVTKFPQILSHVLLGTKEPQVLKGSPTSAQLRTAMALRDQLSARMGLFGQDDETDLADQARQARDRFEQSTARAKELAASANEIGGKIPGEQGQANQSYVSAGTVAASERLTRTYGATGQLAASARQMQDEINKNVEAGKGVMVSVINKLKETTAALNSLQKQVDSLEGSRKANRFGL